MVSTADSSTGSGLPTARESAEVAAKVPISGFFSSLLNTK